MTDGGGGNLQPTGCLVHRSSKAAPELAAALGSDYTITPDIVVVRETEDDSTILRLTAVFSPCIQKRCLSFISGGYGRI
nr:hypothetical protein [Enterobacter asburiae]